MHGPKPRRLLECYEAHDGVGVGGGLVSCLLTKRWMWNWTLLDGTLLLRHLLGVGHLRLRHRLCLCDRVVVGGVLLGTAKVLVVLVLVLVVLVRLLLDTVLFPDS